MAKEKRRGGWPKRSRETLSVRLERGVGFALTLLAEEAGKSRNALIDSWLAALVQVARDMEPDEKGRFQPTARDCWREFGERLASWAAEDGIRADLREAANAEVLAEIEHWKKLDEAERGERRKDRK